MNTIEETSSTEGSLSPPSVSFMESLMECCVEAQDESRAPGPWDPLDNELEQELAKESWLIKEDKLWEVCLCNMDWERQRSEGITGTTPEIGGDENGQTVLPHHLRKSTTFPTPEQHTVYRPSDDHFVEKPATELKYGPQIHKWYSGNMVWERESFLNQLNIYFKKYEHYFNQNPHKKALTVLEHLDSTLMDRWYTEQSGTIELPT